jgi:E3 SUMO-protein ligase RanBP2
MELRTNSTSDRSWVWQTLADFSEETPSQEKLAVRLKSPETAAKFKEVFESLVALAEQRIATDDDTDGKVSETTAKGQITDLKPIFDSIGEVWTCQFCYCANKVEESACVACGFQNEDIKKVETSKITVNAPTAPVLEKNSLLSDKSSIPKLVGQLQQTVSLPKGEGPSKLCLKPVFTIGRGDAPEEELEEESYRHSPSKNSPNKSSTTPTAPVKPTTLTPDTPPTGFAFGSMSHSRFNFRLDLSPDKDPAKSSVKSPQTPTSPDSPGPHPEAEDDGIHFEPIIPLPKKVTKKTGEENEVVLFCHRSKLFRYYNEGNQWKERGIGDIKILQNTSTGKCRVIMRRDNVLKICANHQITQEMTLKPNAGSEKSWVWNTVADFADEVAKQETLAVRFKSSEVALSFRDAFEKAKDGIVNTNVSEKEGEIELLEKDSTETQKTILKPSTDDQPIQDQTTTDAPEQNKKYVAFNHFLRTFAGKCPNVKLFFILSSMKDIG